MSDTQMQPQDILQYLLEACKTSGASDADARLVLSESISVSVRDRKLETIERDESQNVSLRCFFGKRQASVSGADLSRDGLATLSERCSQMARTVPEDPYCGLVSSEMLATHIPDLDLSGDRDNTTQTLEAEALGAEAAALSLKGIQQVSSCGASWSRSQRWVAASNGFTACKTGGISGLGLAAIAKKNGAMETDYCSRSARRREDRLSPGEIGLIAAERTLARLGARRLPSQTAAVIFDRRISDSLLSALINAISGPSIARGVSFLKDSLGTQVFTKGINIYDDPYRPRGMGSRGHDGEGLPVAKRALIKDGILTDWLLNSTSARQLNMAPNGFSGISFGDTPGISTSNVYLEAGAESPQSLMAASGKGLIVTSMFGPSINPNSGDYSVGVSGIWYEYGEPAYPVSEVTIAGDLPSMFERLVPANDLELLGARDAPSLLVEGMTIAGT